VATGTDFPDALAAGAAAGAIGISAQTPVAGAPAWVADLYARLRDRLNELGVSPSAGPPQK